jgi:predicted lipoprotein with Yx(FWY)xxD motif
MDRTRAATLKGGCLAIGLAALAGIPLSGCGGGGGEPAEADAASVAESAVVKATSTPLGAVLVDSRGMTLYDTRGDDPMLYQFEASPTPSCYEACAEAWHPLLTADRPEARGAAKESMLGTIPRSDGTRQVTYDGHPLYTSTEDSEPGETNGAGTVSFGMKWHAVAPDGEEAPG